MPTIRVHEIKMIADAKNLLMGKRVFIVEDDVINVYVLTKPLSACGAMVYSNWDSIGIETHIAQHLPVDIIILDIMLRRGINGYDTFARLQENPKLKNIPVVAVTSLNPETEIPKAKALGFAGYIGEPIDAHYFAQDIADIVKSAKKWIVSR